MILQVTLFQVWEVMHQVWESWPAHRPPSHHRPPTHIPSLPPQDMRFKTGKIEDADSLHSSLPCISLSVWMADRTEDRSLLILLRARKRSLLPPRAPSAGGWGMATADVLWRPSPSTNTTATVWLSIRNLHKLLKKKRGWFKQTNIAHPKSKGCTSGGVYVPRSYRHARWELP